MSNGVQREGLESEAGAFFLHPAVVAAGIALSGSVAPDAPFPALCVAALWACLFVARERRATRTTCLLLVGFLLLFVGSGARATGATDQFQAEYFRTAQLLGEPRRCAGRVIVETSPTVRTQGDEGPVALWTGRSQKMECEGKSLPTGTRIRLYGGPLDLGRDDAVEVVAGLAPPRLFRNAGLSSPWPGAARRNFALSGSTLSAERIGRSGGLSSEIDAARARVRARILATYPPEAAPLARALVLGESDLNEEEAEAFRQSGLLHLLAVSGTHLVIAVLTLVEVLRAILVRVGPLSRRFDVTRASASAGAVLSIAYADFAGGSGSAWRAAFMLCLVCGGRALGGKVRGASALGWSILIGLALEPLAGSDYSFLLSALATAGLIGLGQPLARWATRGPLERPALKQLTSSLVATVASTLPCSPVLALMDGDMTLAALFANLVAAPLGELVALPACLLHALCAPLPELERGLALLGSGALLAVREVALWSASVKGAQFPVPYPSPWVVATLVVSCLLSSAWMKHLSVARCVVGSVGFMLAWFIGTASARSTSPAARLAITALDVGQGDALFVDFPDGTKALVDGGGFPNGRPDPGAEVILPYLRSRGIRHLDLMVVSHAHLDHVLGLLTVARRISIGELWVPIEDDPPSAWVRELSALTEQSGGKVFDSKELCQRGPFPHGGVTVEALSPCKLADPPFGENDGSLVLRLTHGKHRALLTGDIEGPAEAALLQDVPDRLQATYLKVAHHGSDTSSSEPFLDAVRPTVAVISSGIRNRFRHPRPEPLADLLSRGAAVARTDRLGSVTWTTNGSSHALSSFSWAPPAAPRAAFERELSGLVAGLSRSPSFGQSSSP